MAVAFDPGSLKTSGSVFQLPIDIETHASNGWAGFAVSKTGTLVYREDILKNVEVVWSDENGKDEIALDSAARITAAVASPDNRKIAVVRDGDVWIYDRQRGVYTRLTQTEQVELYLVWTPDSREIVYARDVPQYDIFKRSADGSGVEQLVITSRRDKSPSSITPDGKMLVYRDDAGSSGADMFIAPVDPADKTAPKVLIAANGNQGWTSVSPDGRWLLYISFESGRQEIYVAAYPIGRGPARQQVSPSGGGHSLWGNDGRSIYYSSSDRITRVKFDSQTGNIGTPEILSRIPRNIDWTIGPDGRFLLQRVAQVGEHRPLKVILNWAVTLQEMSRRTK